MSPEAKVPPVIYATQTLTSWTVVECLVALGQGRMVIEPPKGPHADVAYAVEWPMVISLPPEAAFMLHKQLAEFVDNYERQFGRISFDPKTMPSERVGNIISMPGVSIEKSEGGVPLGRRETVFHDSGFVYGKDVSSFHAGQDVSQPVVPAGPEAPAVDSGGSRED